MAVEYAESPKLLIKIQSNLADTSVIFAFFQFISIVDEKWEVKNRGQLSDQKVGVIARDVLQD